jgi:quinol monooxygenase YgiN
MTIIVAGTVRVPPENVQALKPHMLTMITATRAEDGCVEYGYSEDVAEPGLFRIFEAWRDKDALKAHFNSPHMGAWRAAGEAAGVGDRKLVMYESDRNRPL